MTGPRAWTQRALSDLEDDLLAADRMNVFVPSVMGAGILISLGIFFSDLARRLGLLGGERRHRATVKRRAARLVAPAASVAGVEPPPIPPLRRPRSSLFYLLTVMAALSFAFYVGVGSTFNFLRPFGPFSGEIWMISLAVATAVLGLGIGAVALVVLVTRPRMPRWARLVVEYTVLGRLES